MAMSMDGTSLLASGHPDPRLKNYRVENLPPHLDLARSDNLGETWAVETDLLGRRDFHAIVPTADGIFAADSQGQILRRDLDGQWVELGPLTAQDLAINLKDTSQQIATQLDSSPSTSADGGLTWQPIEDSPNLHEIEWPEENTLLGASVDGQIWAAKGPLEPWQEATKAPPNIETFYVNEQRWWVTVKGGAIHTTTDEGQTWTIVYKSTQK